MRNGLTDRIIDVISNVVSLVPWPERRLAMAEVTDKLLDGRPRVAEDVFGWGRGTVILGKNELRTGINCKNDLSSRRKPKEEEKSPKLLHDIHAIMNPDSQAEHSLRTALKYSNKTAASVRSALLEGDWTEESLPCTRTISNILLRNNYRLRRVDKSQVKKKRK